MELFSPAKINLFLKILRKREDGFHEISSLFQAVDLGINSQDLLTFSLATEDRLTCSDPRLPLNENNLVLKALTLFRKKTSLYFPLHIHLEKKIPVEAGLGGGSSNAATTLFALNKFSHLDLPLQTLQEWGGELGSDVPFFFSQGCAYCTGRGEKVIPLPTTYPLKDFWLVKPPQGLLTSAIFSKLCLENKDNLAINDLEKPALELLPSLKLLKENLIEQGCEAVYLTGSGSGLVCIHRQQPEVPSTVQVFPLNPVSRSGKEWYEKPSSG